MFVQGFGFPVNRLFDLLFEVRDQYNETLLKKWALVFRWASLTCGVCHSRMCRNTKKLQFDDNSCVCGKAFFCCDVPVCLQPAYFV